MKYSTQPNGGKVSNYPAVSTTERQPEVATDIQNAQKVDPSVRLGPLRGEPNGAVPLARTMAKPQAYKAKKGPP